jgi:hypothetical protein
MGFDASEVSPDQDVRRLERIVCRKVQRGENVDDRRAHDVGRYAHGDVRRDA